MNVVFVNYGAFGNDSANHIEGFALHLAGQGHHVGVLAEGDPPASLGKIAASNPQFADDLIADPKCF